MMERIKILVVDDSAVVRQALTSILSREKSFSVAAAADPIIAMNKMQRERPDVILLDLEMPRMDGLTFLKKIMREDPIPVVICSGIAERGSEVALKALDEGAVEIVTKPRLGVQEFLYESSVLLVDKVRAAAQAKLRGRSPAIQPVEPRFTADAVLPPPRKIGQRVPTDRVAVIGASTGGTEALRTLLEAMPPDAPGMVIVQHMPEGFTRAFADRLNQTCSMEVREAAAGDAVLRGQALVAPGNRHILLQRRGAGYFVELTDGPLVSRHRPSVDVLFRSAARAAGPNAVGVIMTGMGDDGAEGLFEMRSAGAATLAQDQASCVVFGMPKEAISRGAVDEVVSLHLLPSAILKLSRRPLRERPA